MDQLVQFYFKHALAPTTLRTYQSAFKRYHDFCSAHNNQLFPLSELQLCQFVATLASQGVSHKSLKGYLSALRFFQISHNNEDPKVNEMVTLQYVLRGIKGVQSKSSGFQPRVRLPITPHILLSMRRAWEANAPDFDCDMLWAAACTCFFGFLRSGEATVPSLSGYDPQVHLSIGDVSVDSNSSPTAVRLHIKASKTDPFRLGVHIFLGKTNSPLCPVTALLSYISKRGLSPGPLFKHGNNRPLTRDTFVQEVKSALGTAGYDSSCYAGHSFRIGAATTAAAAGVEDCLIKTLGRWQSTAYLAYVKVPRETLTSISARLARM